MLKRFFGGFFISCVAVGMFTAFPARVAHADGICWTVTPAPTPRPKIDYLTSCTLSGGGGATPIPYPTGTGGVLLVQPTNAPTFGVTVQNTPTPVPTPAAVATTVASSATSVTLLAAGLAVNGVSFCNNSTQIAYLSMTTPATSALYFLPIPAAGTVPSCVVQQGPNLYKNAWYGIWASANGTMIVTYW